MPTEKVSEAILGRRAINRETLVIIANVTLCAQRAHVALNKFRQHFLFLGPYPAVYHVHIHTYAKGHFFTVL